jgi:hypothetical protein
MAEQWSDGISFSPFSKTVTPLLTATAWRTQLGVDAYVNDQLDLRVDARQNSVPKVGPLTRTAPLVVSWMTAQIIGNSVTTLMLPQLATGGAGDEGYHVITRDGIRNSFDTLSNLVFTDVKVYSSSGAVVPVTSVQPTPPRVTFPTAGTLGDRVTLWRKNGSITVTRRALGVRASIRLVHGVLGATTDVLIDAKLNGVSAGTLAMRMDPVSTVSEGQIAIPAAKFNDKITFEITQVSGTFAGIQSGSTIVIDTLSELTTDTGLLVGGLHQGAGLVDADIPALAQMDMYIASNIWSGNIASSNTIVHGQKFFDGYVSNQSVGVFDRLNAARAQRSALAMPNGPTHLIYVVSTVGALDGTLAGQAKFDRFPSVTAGQSVFTATRDVTMLPIGGQFSCGAWVQIVKVAGQYQMGYGQLYNLISAGVYELVTTVSGVTATIRWSGVGLRTLTITLSTPLVVGDYFAIAHGVTLNSDFWDFDDVQSRLNIEEMLTATFKDSKSLFDGLFVDLCNPQFISKEALHKTLYYLRAFARQGMLCCNALSASAESIEFIATSPSMMTGDMIMMEGAGCSVGVAKVAETLAAVAERDRISQGGKHIRLVWLATIAQSTVGPVETNAAIIAARDLFLANSRPGDVFMCHWSGLGTPYNGAVRPLPARIAGVTGWG